MEKRACLKKPKGKIQSLVVVPAFNPSAGEVETGGFLGPVTS